MMAASAGVRRMGAAALDLAWTAAGRLDGFWERNLQALGLAAGIVILREAGGYVTDADGKERMLDEGQRGRRQRGHPAHLLKLLKSLPSVPNRKRGLIRVLRSETQSGTGRRADGLRPGPP